jgi:ubiquinone/menaquinone biosynthesis C-methylase UbiE
MKVYSTEIASDKIRSDNPIHQRLLKAYYIATEYVTGSLLEIGCGEGRGVELLAPVVLSYTAIDKIPAVVEQLKDSHPDHQFDVGVIPPLPYQDNQFESVVSFQVIEHIKKDELFLSEIHRVLKPGGTALITTPNIKLTLSRNPWHIREYTAEQLQQKAAAIFRSVQLLGISGNDKVMQYYDSNKASVQKITRFDFLDLQHRLPASILKVPYEILNRFNRNKLLTAADDLVTSIRHTDYLVSDNADTSLDLLCLVKK